MADRADALIDLKRGLDAQELHLLSIELDRRRKSVGVTYFLWFFLSWIALHKFYLSKVGEAILYLVAPWVGGVLLLLGGLAKERGDAGGSFLAGLGVLLFIAYFVWWFVDLFTIPRQVTRYNEALEASVIRSIQARRGFSTGPPRDL